MERAAVRRVRAALEHHSVASNITVLSDSTRTALDAARALKVEVGQIAASLVFRLPDDAPLLVITSGRHRVDVGLLAEALDVSHLSRADADFVKTCSGFSIGGVSPVGWEQNEDPIVPMAGIDVALAAYDVIWAAAGHPHAVFATTFGELARASGARTLRVAND